MASATIGANTVAYKFNGLDQRVSKTGPTAVVPSGAAYYAYDEAGQLIGEYDASVKPGFETINLGTTPVAVLKQTGSASNSTLQVVAYNVWADHLDTPRVVTRSSDQAIVWRWDSAEAFGATAPNQNPNALGVFSYNQRFPGQLVDLETGNFYNWYRDYRAGVGRYVQSDPIGLAGGINTYAYLGGNPISRVDPPGLCPHCLGATIVGGAFGAISGGYGAFIGGGKLSDILIGAAIGGAAGAVAGAAISVGAMPAAGAALLNFGVNAQGNLVGQGIAYNNADPCKKPKLNLGAALTSGIAAITGGLFGPAAGNSVGAMIGAAAIGLPADMAINAAGGSLFPTQYYPPEH